MQKKDWFVMISVLVLIAAGIFLPKQIENLLATIRNSLLPETVELGAPDIEESLDITLPEFFQEITEEKMTESETEKDLPSIAEGLGENGTSVLGESLSGPAPQKSSEPGLSLDEIRERVGEIEQKTAAISQRVTVLARAQEGKMVAGEVWNAEDQEVQKQVRMAQIQEQINDISQKIIVLSEQLNRMLEASDTSV